MLWRATWYFANIQDICYADPSSNRTANIQFSGCYIHPPFCLPPQRGKSIIKVHKQQGSSQPWEDCQEIWEGEFHEWTEADVSASRATTSSCLQERGNRCCIPDIRPVLNQSQKNLTWAKEKKWTSSFQLKSFLYFICKSRS